MPLLCPPSTGLTLTQHSRTELLLLHARHSPRWGDRAENKTDTAAATPEFRSLPLAGKAIK